MSNEVLQGFAELTELSSVTTDWGKASQNEALKATVKLPYWNPDTKLVEYNNTVKGFLTAGFGWSIQNNFEDLLPVTGFQQGLTRFAQGGSAVVGALQSITGMDFGKVGDFANQMAGQTVMSLQQTISVWMNMQKPTFNISLLFFDGRGDDTTSVTTAAYMIERALYPLIGDTLDPSGTLNLTMLAPGGYKPSIRNDNKTGNPNKVFGLTCEGLGSLMIGNYALFPEIICTGGGFQFSDRMLNNGKPQWLNATLNFTMWKQPTLGELAFRYY